MTDDGLDWMEYYALEHPVYGRMHYRRFSHAWWFVESTNDRDEDVTADDVSMVAFQAGVLQ